MILVPLELAVLAQKNNQLTPELAMGWRLGRHAHEWFDGLDQVQIAATGHDDILAALRRVARFPETGTVVRPIAPRPWDMLFFHEPTGTALKVVCIRQRITLPQPIRELEEKLACGDPEIPRRYQDGLATLIGEIVTGDLTGFCLVSEIRCRVLALDEKKHPARCPWCLATEKSHLVEVDGRICCPACAGLEPDWLAG